jgi:type II secretion system protein G
MYNSNYVSVVTPSGRKCRAMRRTGFTLIEVLIVIVVIAILAAIIVPRVLGAGRESREASLRAQLQEMRNAIGRFEKDCGCYPAKLDDVMATMAPKVGANGVKIEYSKFGGPYLTTPDGGLPSNPVNYSNAVGVAGATRDEPVGWIYNPKTGEVHADSGTAVNGKDYGEW